MSKPPKIVVPGLNRGAGIPAGYILGRRPGTGHGPAELLDLTGMKALGVATGAGLAQSASVVASTAASATTSLSTGVSSVDSGQTVSLSQISSSLSGAISSTSSLSSAVSTVISGSISTVNSRIDSLSTAVGGGGADDDSALSTSLSQISNSLSTTNSTNVTQSTSLSQISSSLSGAISSTSSLSTAVSTVDLNQSTSLSQISNSLSTTNSTNVTQSTSLSQISSSLSGAISSTSSLSTAIGTGAAALVYEDATVPGGNTVANTTTPTAFASSYTIPANSLAVGSVIRVKIYGIYSTALVAPTITAALKIGSVTVLTTGAITAIAGETNGGWWAEALLTVTAIGASGAMECQGYAEFSTAATTGLSVNLTNTAVVGSIDTTGSLAMTVNVTWGTASASNTITLREMAVEIMTVGAAGSGGGGSFRGALATKSADQTAANFTTRAAMTWDTNSYDTDSIHNTSSNTSRMSVPSGVTYVRLTASVQVSAYTGSFADLMFFRNGVQEPTSASVLAYGSSAGAIWLNLVSPVLSVTAGDYFEAMLEINGDSSVTIVKTSSSFAMEIIR